MGWVVYLGSPTAGEIGPGPTIFQNVPAPMLMLAVCIVLPHVTFMARDPDHLYQMISPDTKGLASGSTQFVNREDCLAHKSPVMMIMPSLYLTSV